MTAVPTFLRSEIMPPISIRSTLSVFLSLVQRRVSILGGPLLAIACSGRVAGGQAPPASHPLWPGKATNEPSAPGRRC